MGGCRPGNLGVMEGLHPSLDKAWLVLAASWHSLFVHAGAATIPLSLQYKMALRRRNKHFRSIRPTPTVRSKVTGSVGAVLPPQGMAGLGGSQQQPGALTVRAPHSDGLRAAESGPFRETLPVPWLESVGEAHLGLALVVVLDLSWLGAFGQCSKCPDLPPHTASWG